MSLGLVAAVGAISAPGVAVAATPSKHKQAVHKKRRLTARQIRAAVAKAERSPDLWATVNVCASTPSQDSVGIRGQMPSLGFPAILSMDILIDYWNPADTKFEPTSATSSLSLGMRTHGVHQGGATFHFAPSPFLVRGSITFTWTIGTKVIGTVTRNTGHGYPNVGFSDPPGFSAGTCSLT